MMSFLVDDLLDFAQMNTGKFRKVIKEFDLREAIEEVVQIQIDKAKMGNIKLDSVFKSQPDDKNEIISLFNKVSTSKKTGNGKCDQEDSADSDNDCFNYDFAIEDNLKIQNFKPETKISVSTDKRRLQQVLLNI